MAKMTGKQRQALAKIALELKDRIEGEEGDTKREALECAASYFWNTVRAAFGSDAGVLDIMHERDVMVEAREREAKLAKAREAVKTRCAKKCHLPKSKRTKKACEECVERVASVMDSGFEPRHDGTFAVVKG